MVNVMVHHKTQAVFLFGNIRQYCYLWKLGLKLLSLAIITDLPRLTQSRRLVIMVKWTVSSTEPLHSVYNIEKILEKRI